MLTPRSGNVTLSGMATDAFTVEYLELINGSRPFVEWVTAMTDVEARAIILRRIARLRGGNFGNCKSVSTDIRELRIDYGPGYRVYFAMRSRTIAVVLCAGTKKTQLNDIRNAQKLWETYTR